MLKTAELVVYTSTSADVSGATKNRSVRGEECEAVGRAEAE